MTSQDHHRFMQAALALGRRELGATWPNPAVGALIVRDGVVIGRGWTRAGGRPHAEPEALRQAGKAARGATLYVTLEPCSHHGRTPPCAEAVINAGLARVVSAMEDPDARVAGRGHALLRAAGIEVITSLCEAEARHQHAGHIARVTRDRPHVSVKLALSANECVAFADRRPAAITGEEARGRVHMMRAQADAIAIGIGTALSDDPLLTCRLPGMEARSPVRVVFDKDLHLPPTSQLVRTARETPLWVLTTSQAPAVALEEQGVDVLRLETSATRAALEALAARGITRLMVEGGPVLVNALLADDCVDEMALLNSPNPLENGLAAFDAPVAEILKRQHFTLAEQNHAGADLFRLFIKRV